MKRTVTLLLALIGLTVSGASAQETATTSVVATQTPLKQLQLPLELKAKDFITKVYGILDSDMNKDEIVSATQTVVSLVPEEDEYGLWLESGNGYSISYYGMTPEVSARAAFDEGNNVSDYGFFFLFPYSDGGREEANSRQAKFSGALLQEFLDMGLAMEVDTLSDAIYEVSGDYENDLVDVRLIEEHETDDNSGRFILILTVNPDDPDMVTAEL